MPCPAATIFRGISSASGWEKGQVENQVGVIRRRFFVPRPRFKNYAELNAWLEDRRVAWAKTQPHPELSGQTIWKVFEAERSSLVPYVGPFDGVHAVPASVSKTCLVRFDNNRYSVEARAVGRPVEIRAYAERVEFWQDGQIVGQHARAFGRNKAVYDPLHDIPVLARKPGALRNGAPFKDWGPAAFDAARPAQAGPRAERCPPDGQHPGGCPDRRAGRRRGRLRRSAERGRSLRRGHSQHSCPPARAGTAPDHRDAGCAASELRAGRRLPTL